MLDLDGPWISYSGLANVPQVLLPMLRADIINQSRHLSDTPANLHLNWNFLTIHKTAAGTGSDLLLLTQQAGPVLLIRVHPWPGHQATWVVVQSGSSGQSALGRMMGLRVASMTGQRVGNVALEYERSLETLGGVAEPVLE